MFMPSTFHKQIFISTLKLPQLELIKMNDLEKLHANLIRAEETHATCIENAQQKTEEFNNLKFEMSDLKARLVEVDRLLSNAKKGIGISLSIDELTSLKKESSETSSRIDDLGDFIPMTQNTITEINSSSTGASRHVRSLKDEITNIFADKAAAEVVSLSSVGLKDLLHTSMSLYGFNFTGRPKDTNDLYLKIGERLCKQLFTSENEYFALPTIQQSMAERDGMIEKLA